MQCQEQRLCSVPRMGTVPGVIKSMRCVQGDKIRKRDKTRTLHLDGGHVGDVEDAVHAVRILPNELCGRGLDLQGYGNYRL